MTREEIISDILLGLDLSEYTIDELNETCIVLEQKREGQSCTSWDDCIHCILCNSKRLNTKEKYCPAIYQYSVLTRQFDSYRDFKSTLIRNILIKMYSYLNDNNKSNLLYLLED